MLGTLVSHTRGQRESGNGAARRTSSVCDPPSWQLSAIGSFSGPTSPESGLLHARCCRATNARVSDKSPKGRRAYQEVLCIWLHPAGKTGSTVRSGREICLWAGESVSVGSVNLRNGISRSVRSGVKAARHDCCASTHFHRLQPPARPQGHDCDMCSPACRVV
jgi:hypothetical protein